MGLKVTQGLPKGRHEEIAPCRAGGTEKACMPQGQTKQGDLGSQVRREAGQDSVCLIHQQKTGPSPQLAP